MLSCELVNEPRRLKDPIELILAGWVPSAGTSTAVSCIIIYMPQWEKQRVLNRPINPHSIEYLD